MLFVCYLNWTDQGAKAVKGVAARHENLKTEIAGLGGRWSIEVLEDGVAQPRTLSLFPEDRCEGLLAHKQAVFDHLTGRWRDLFNISYDVLLYDLTSTYFEADPPFPEGDKRRFGYSRADSDEVAR